MTAPAGKKSRQRNQGVPGGRRRYTKVSVTLPSELLEDIRQRVGPGNLSRHLSAVLEDDARRAALREFLDAMAAEHGPISEEEIEEVRRRWSAARAAR